MAAPSDITYRSLQIAPLSGEIEALRLEFNKAVTNLRTLTAKLDADAGVTDTNYAALITDASASGPAKIQIIG